MTRQSAWVHEAVARIEADAVRSADTHLIRVELPACPGVTLYLKDESTHPTSSLKHRLARSLFLYALCNGWLRSDTGVVEASSGSTAVSEAYFARLLGLPFTAVVPRSTSPEKIAAIEFQGGRCHYVDHPGEARAASHRLAAATGAHFMDQFTYAERATDWRGNNNIAESIFRQMAAEPYPVPAWIVVGAGTGGTSATIGRYLAYRRLPTSLWQPAAPHRLPLLGAALLPVLVKGMFAPLPVPERFKEGFPHGMAVRPSQIRAEAQDGATMAYGVASMRDGYQGLQMPVVIVAGTEDQVVDVGRHAVRLQGDIPGSELRLVPGAGHMVHHAVPGLVAELVEAVSDRSAASRSIPHLPASAGV